MKDVFNKTYKVLLEYSELNADRDVEFDSLQTLHEYIVNHYKKEENLPVVGYYNKMKLTYIVSNDRGDTLQLNLGGLCRLDIGKANGDFNPFKQTLIEYIQYLYSDDTIHMDDIVVKIDFSNIT